MSETCTHYNPRIDVLMSADRRSSAHDGFGVGTACCACFYFTTVRQTVLFDSKTTANKRCSADPKKQKGKNNRHRWCNNVLEKYTVCYWWYIFPPSINFIYYTCSPRTYTKPTYPRNWTYAWETKTNENQHNPSERMTTKQKWRYSSKLFSARYVCTCCCCVLSFGDTTRACQLIIF